MDDGWAAVRTLGLRLPPRRRDSHTPRQRLAFLMTVGLAGFLVACTAWSSLQAAFLTGSTALGSKRSFSSGLTPHSWRTVTDEKLKPSLASEWRLNVGHALDVLRHDTVALFDELEFEPDFSIFDENIEILDARMPSFQLRGLQTYQQVLASLRWWVRSSCDTADLTITSVSPPVNNEIYMRWRLMLLPKDVIASATGWLAPLGMARSMRTMGIGPGTPFIIEGYSKYEFHPWSGKIVKHTIDITNPPIAILDLIRQYAQGPSWLTPVHNGVGIPTAMRSLPPVAAMGPAGAVATARPSAPFTGSTRMAQQATKGGSSRASTMGGRAASPWLNGILPQSCDDDFECNDGKANFPMQCCEVPLLGNFCCKPSDYEPAPSQPAYVPIPVPVEDDPRATPTPK